MDLPDDVPGKNDSPQDVAPGVFNMTLKSFDSEAVDLKRGLRVRQTLNNLRTLGQLDHELRSQSKGLYKAISYQPARPPE